MKESYFNCNKDSNTVVDNSKPSKKHNMPVLNEGSYFGSKLFDMCVLDEDWATADNTYAIAKNCYARLLKYGNIGNIQTNLESLPKEQQGPVINLMNSFFRNDLNKGNVDQRYSLLFDKFSKGAEANPNIQYDPKVGTLASDIARDNAAAQNSTSLWQSFKDNLSAGWKHTADSFSKLWNDPSNMSGTQMATVGAVIAAGALGTYWLWKKFKKNGKLTEQDYKQAEVVQREAEQRKASGNYDANKQLAL